MSKRHFSYQSQPKRFQTSNFSSRWLSQITLGILRFWVSDIFTKISCLPLYPVGKPKSQLSGKWTETECSETERNLDFQAVTLYRWRTFGLVMFRAIFWVIQCTCDFFLIIPFPKHYLHKSQPKFIVGAGSTEVKYLLSQHSSWKIRVSVLFRHHKKQGFLR